jgi:surface protein
MNNIITITTKEQLRDIILSGKFNNSTQVKNSEHICSDGSVYDYSSITDLSELFFLKNNIKKIPLFDTSNVTNMDSMFEECNSLITIPLFNTSNVVSMSEMFFNCHSLKSIPNLDTSNVLDMSFMFFNCISLFLISDIYYNPKETNYFGLFTSSSLPKLEQLRFFYQHDKIILNSLDINLLTETQKNNLFKKYD